MPCDMAPAQYGDALEKVQEVFTLKTLLQRAATGAGEEQAWVHSKLHKKGQDIQIRCQMIHTWLGYSSARACQRRSTTYSSAPVTDCRTGFMG